MSDEPAIISLDWRAAGPGARVVYRDDEAGLAVGVWSLTPGEGFPRDVVGAPAGCVIVGEGALGRAVGAADGLAWAGGEKPATTADAPARGVFLILQDCAARSTAAAVATLSPADDARLPVLDAAHLDAPQDRDLVRLSAFDAAFTAGLWVSAPFDTGPITFSYHELAMIREGAATIEDADASAHAFTPGDAFFIPQGASCRWRVGGKLTKTYSAYAR